jgi:MYXO-CTERM domain-containing protein
VDAPDEPNDDERLQIQSQPKGASCGCGSAGGDPIALLGAVALLMLRRRKRAR